MKKHLVTFAVLGISLLSYANPVTPWMVDYYKAPAQKEAGCPSFPSPAYNSLTYNTGCIPWDLEWSGSMSGDVTGATYQWYRYKESEGSATAQPCSWQTDHSTPEGFKPATDENNTRYIYFCKVTTPSCPSGVNSATFTVVVGSATDPCLTLTGTTFTITSGGSYTSGQTVTITATTSAYGGDHVYTWYHNGEPMDTTVNIGHYEFVWGFNQPKLIIHNVTPADGGTYSVMLQDGSECFMYTDPVRILVDNPSCGPNPTLAVQKSEMAEGETNQTGVANNTLASGEIGQLVYMVQPEGSNPSTTVGTWTTDKPGLYQFKYVVDNPDNPSCYRESKVVTIRVYACGPEPTITPDADLVKTTGTVHFTTTGLGEYETGTITFSKDGGAGGNAIYPADAHTCYNSGTYTYTYTVTNSKAPGCTRTATCEVIWYSCGWVTARFNNWVAEKIKLGNSINLGPAVPTETGMIGILTVSKDGGTPEVIPTSSPYTPTEPGTYVFHYEVKHSDPRVTDCYSEVSKTIVVEPCGTKATLTTNKTVLTVGESATLTMSAKASGETVTLTYSKDGGANNSLTISNNKSTFTPTEPGTYVLTYTITNSGCGSNSAQVTINVYGCGQDASITATPDPVRVGQPITLTLSALGADESATLTYTVNGGNKSTINNQQSTIEFTPTELGTYVFTYAITHAYINCSRSAQATVQVLDCDADVTVSTDKTVAAVGEAVAITLSRTANSRETASLTYTVNGGTQSPISNLQSPITFNPTVPGVYEITYTLTDAVLGCVTTDKTSFTVYECGPEASVSASRTTVRTEDEIIITVSAPGANETGTLTVSKNGGAPQSVTAGAWSTTEEGTYTFTYTITHAYINCTRSSQVVVGVSDCGEPVTLTSDKSIYTLGETVTFSLSRTANADETPSFTISKDGGTPSPLSGNSPLTFTPTEAGTYTAVYTLNNTILSCETTGEVIFTVYECGPEATVSLDKTAVRVGEAVTLTLSALGAEETSTLTYTVNGGTQSPISNLQSPIEFTPSEIGEYVFTYSITHPYIDCARSASVTLAVYDCGTPAAVAADKSALRLGESVQLTLSAVLPVENATLVYSFNGSDTISVPNYPSSVTGNPSAISFTPDAVGEYVFTYIVSHTVIDCQTSAQVTVNVYDCGPEAAITIPVTELKLLRTTTITLSELGADESATLTYTVNGGNKSTINNQQSTIEFTPTELGTYVFTYSVTHPYIDCSRTATATLSVVEAELVFDDKNGTHVWSDPKNWWPAYNRLPNLSDSAIIRQSCMVDVADAHTYDLTIDIPSDVALTIQPAGALTVAHHLLQSRADAIVIQANAGANGALVLGEENTDIPATVHFYARSAEKNALYPTWQYMGYPLQNQALISAVYPEAVFYEWTNTPNKKTGGNWQRVDSLAGQVVPFTGYCMTQEKEQTYTLQGLLNNPVRKDIALPHNDQGKYPDFAFVANSWVAPIDIAALETADFGAADATVYIMNAGTYEQALVQQTNASYMGTGSAKGQYNTIPVHAAPYMSGALTVIPPMQGFFVHAKAETTLSLDYHRVVYTPALTKVNTTATRAPKNDQSPISNLQSVESVLRLNVSGFNAQDEVYLLAGSEFSNAFDNGWDGYKAVSEKSPISFSVKTVDGPMAVAALPEFEGAELVFDGGNHKTYTITISSQLSALGSQLYLLDKETSAMTPLEDGAQYSFKCGAEARRFVITKRTTDDQSSITNDEPYKFIRNGILYIRSGERLYNGNGELIRIE